MAVMPSRLHHLPENLRRVYQDYLTSNGARRSPGGRSFDEATVLQQYKAELQRWPQLTHEEQVALMRLVRTGDATARGLMILSNQRLVFWQARAYRNRGLSLLELIQEGNIGLISAVGKFDPERGVRFSCYALPSIRRAILDALVETGNAIRLPSSRYRERNRLAWAMTNFYKQQGRWPTDQELSELTGLSRKTISFLRQFLCYPISMDALHGWAESDHPGSGRGLLDILIDQTPSGLSPEMWVTAGLELIHRLTELERMLVRLGRWSPRYLRVFVLRYGLDRSLYKRTFAEVGQVIGHPRQRAQQIEANCLAKLFPGESRVGSRVTMFSNWLSGLDVLLELHEGRIRTRTTDTTVAIFLRWGNDRRTRRWFEPIIGETKPGQRQ